MKCPEHLDRDVHMAPGIQEQELNPVRRMCIQRSDLGGGDSEFKGKKS